MQRKKTETGRIGFKTFRKWSLCEDFTVKTDDDDQISLLKCKICSERFKWVHFLACLDLSSIVEALCHFQFHI